MSWVFARSMREVRRDFSRMAPVGLLGLLGVLGFAGVMSRCGRMAYFMIIIFVFGLISAFNSSISGTQLFSGRACQKSTAAPSCLGTSYSD